MISKTWTRLALGLTLLAAPAFVGCGETTTPPADTTPVAGAPPAASAPAAPGTPGSGQTTPVDTAPADAKK